MPLSTWFGKRAPTTPTHIPVQFGRSHICFLEKGFFGSVFLSPSKFCINYDLVNTSLITLGQASEFLLSCGQGHVRVCTRFIRCLSLNWKLGVQCRVAFKARTQHPFRHSTLTTKQVLRCFAMPCFVFKFTSPLILIFTKQALGIHPEQLFIPATNF